MRALVALSAIAGAVSAAATQSSEGWALEKYVLSIHSGTALDVQNFFLRHKICEEKQRCPSDLGCGMLRSWCTIRLPYPSKEFANRTGELHWVDAPTLADLTVDGRRGMDVWVERFNALNGNLTQFNALMHNKAQLYTSDLAPYSTTLAAEGVPTMRRTSKDSDGHPVAHLSFSVAGRIYELVGPLSTLPGDAPEPWRDQECPPAHSLGTSLASLWGASMKSAVSVDTMLVGVSITHHDPTGPALQGATTHLKEFTGAKVHVEAEHPSCTVLGLRWDSMPDLTVRYVRSSGPGAALIKEYDSCAAQCHANNTARKPFGRGWDHILDQHLGMWYGQPKGECEPLASKVRAHLVEDHLPVGERQEPDAHLFYVGYPGPMAWEYQFQHCDAGHPEAGTECACRADNRPNDDGACPRNHTDCTDWCA